jgi:hypothetical protein
VTSYQYSLLSSAKLIARIVAELRFSQGAPL